MRPLRITAKVDYAVRAAIELADADRTTPIKGDRIAEAQDIPMKFLENILSEMKRSGLVRSQRGAEGGYALAKPAAEITIASVIREVDGPLAEVRGLRPHETTYSGVAEHLPQVWVAVRAAIRAVLDETTLAHVLRGELPPHVVKLLDTPEAWLPR